MLPGDHLPVDHKPEQSNATKGGASLEEILPARRGNTIPTDLIIRTNLGLCSLGASTLFLLLLCSNHDFNLSADSAQPIPASQEAAEPRSPTCPRCGLTVSDHRLRGQLQGPRSSVYNNNNGSSSGKSRSHSTHTPAASDSCFRLLLACLSCQCSAVLLSLLEACSSCLHTLCSSCCHACTRCCSAVQEVPVEELNCHAHCHSVLFESCCEPTECLEFCVDCCEICHRT